MSISNLIKKVEKIETAVYSNSYKSTLEFVESKCEEEALMDRIAQDASNTDYIILRLYVDKDAISSF